MFIRIYFWNGIPWTYSAGGLRIAVQKTLEQHEHAPGNPIGSTIDFGIDPLLDSFGKTMHWAGPVAS